MTKSKRIEKKAMKVAKVAEVKATMTADELLAKSREDFAKKFPSPTPVLAKTPGKKPIVEPEEVVEEIIDDLDRGEEDELEIIEVTPIKDKKVISQNSAQAQKLLQKATKPEVKDIFPEVIAKKKLADMTPKEKATYYANLSKKATAAKVAKAEAKLAAEGKTGQLKNVPETTPKVVKKATRTAAAEPIANPLGGKVIPEGTTGSKLKTLLKEEKKAAKKGSKPATVRTKTTTPLSKMTIEELEAIKGTIADVQWNKYYKVAGGGNSGGTIKKVAKPVVVTAKDKLSTLVEKESDFKTVYAPAKKATRTVAEPKAKIITLADFTLDELIAELRTRGCKGSIKVCAEVEL